GARWFRARRGTRLVAHGAGQPPGGRGERGRGRGSTVMRHVAPTRPSDLELMMLVDGELDARRASEVEAHPRRDSDARVKVASLRLVGALVASEQLAMADRAGAAKVADLVMDRIVRENRRPIVRRLAGPSAATGLALAAAAALVLVA